MLNVSETKWFRTALHIVLDAEAVTAGYFLADGIVYKNPVSFVGGIILGAMGAQTIYVRDRIDKTSARIERNLGHNHKK